MAFPVMAAAIEQGLLPDSFSTDLAKLSSADPHCSLLTVASQFMSFGVSFEACVVRMTVGPAENLNRPDLGRLREAGVGDTTLLRVEEGDFVMGRQRRETVPWLSASCLTSLFAQLLHDAQIIAKIFSQSHPHTVTAYTAHL